MNRETERFTMRYDRFTHVCTVRDHERGGIARFIDADDLPSKSKLSTLPAQDFDALVEALAYA
jgi:hypothetical protein